jgi:hypothetical protein
LTAIEAMHLVYVLEPTQGHPEHCLALGVLAFERYLLFLHNNGDYTSIAGTVQGKAQTSPKNRDN